MVLESYQALAPQNIEHSTQGVLRDAQTEVGFDGMLQVPESDYLLGGPADGLSHEGRKGREIISTVAIPKDLEQSEARNDRRNHQHLATIWLRSAVTGTHVQSAGEAGLQL